MPIHDWSRVSAGIRHDFYRAWLPELRNRLKDGLLPFAWAALLLLLAVGCSKRASPPTPEPADTPAEVGVPADRSLTPEVYVQAGIPPCDRRWSAADMADTAKALTALAGKDPHQLPRYQSERSAAVFERITAADNLVPFQDHSLPVQQRLPQALDYLQSANTILKLYVSCFLQQAVGGGDLVELIGMQLRTAVVMIRLMNEFVPTLKKDDPTYLTRMAGIARARQGLATTAMGGLMTLTERGAYRSADLSRLVSYLRDTFPVIIPEMEPGPRSEVLARLEKLTRDPAMADLKPGLQKLREEVQAAVQKAERAPGERAGLNADDLQRAGIRMHRVQAGDPDDSGWCLARSTGGGFSVQLPGRFNDFSQTAKAQDGVTISVHIVSMANALGTKFTAMAMTRPDGKIKPEAFDDLADKYRKEGKRVEKRAVKIAGLSGTALKVVGPSDSARMQSFQTKNGVYQMIVEYPTVLEGASLAETVERFFGSFRLAEEGAQ